MNTSSTAVHISTNHQTLSTVLVGIHRWIERTRIQVHLRLVEKYLRSKPVKQLSPELRRARTQHLDHLHTYWQSGSFPKNIDWPSRRIPYFVDHAGVPCAMAYLMQQAGATELVTTVAATNNHVYINDVTAGPVLDWIQQSGLTQAEAARVQPSYDYDFGYPDGSPAGTAIDIIFALVRWILTGTAFIILEVITYYIASWVGQQYRSRRLLTWFYLTLMNIALTTVVAMLLKEIVEDIQRSL